MPTPVIIESWEHGVDPITSGGGLADLVTGTPTVVTSPVRTGSVYALQINPSAATENAGRGFTAADVVVARGYIQFPSSLPAADAEVVYFPAVAGAQLNLRYDQSSNVFKVDFQAGTEQLHTTTLVANTWYRVELKITFNLGTRICDWKVDGVDGPQASFTVTGSQGNRIRWGTAVAQTFVAVYDDWIVSTTSADYPIGAGGAKGLSPNADGTHNAGTNEMEDQAGADIGVVTAWNLLANVPMNTTADYVQQATAHTVPDAHYAEVAFADISTSVTVNGVVGILAYKSSATTANTGSTIAIRSDATQIGIYGTPAVPTDYSESTLFYKSVIITAPAGGWTPTEVNALKMRVGGSSDAAPLPEWHALMFQVDVVPASTTAITGKDAGASASLASLLGAGALGGKDAANSSALGGLAGPAPLTALGYGVASGVASALGMSALSGSDYSEPGAFGQLLASGALAGQSAGAAASISALQGQGHLVGAIFGMAVAAGNLQALGAGAIAGYGAGYTLAFGTFTASGVLAGRAFGETTATGALGGSAPGILVGQSVGSTVAYAQAKGTGALASLDFCEATSVAALLGAGGLVGRDASYAHGFGAATATGALSGRDFSVAVGIGNLADAPTGVLTGLDFCEAMAVANIVGWYDFAFAKATLTEHNVVANFTEQRCEATLTEHVVVAELAERRWESDLVEMAISAILEEV